MNAVQCIVNETADAGGSIADQNGARRMSHKITEADGPQTKFYARPGQPLKEHLSGVRAETRSRADLPEYGEVIGQLHDLGKYSMAFQNLLTARTDEEAVQTDAAGQLDHSSAGAQYLSAVLAKLGQESKDLEIQRLLALISRILGHAVVGHHSGLLNGVSIQDGPSLERRLVKTVEPDEDNIEPEIRVALQGAAERLLTEGRLDFVCRWIDDQGNVSGRDAFSLQFAVRMLFSALVDADRLDSERAGNPEQCAARRAIRRDSLSILLRKLESHLEKLSLDGDVNRVRKRVSEECRNAASQTPGFFQLTVPTGGGKTFASLRFALHHAINSDPEKRRVIYVMPYTSIIDQNAEEFRRVLDSDGRTKNVLEHHSNLEPTKETIESQLLAENWDAPIIATTNVQFYESLFSSRSSWCRRLHAVRNSVIVLDEAQTVPVQYLQAITWALEELVQNHGCTVVLCTATQPVLDSRRIDDEGVADNHRVGLRDIRPIIKEPTELYRSLKRVRVHRIESTRPLSVLDVAGHVALHAGSKRSVLSIVNTKKNARRLFEELKRNDCLSNRLFHLSTAMCPSHRKDVIAIVKRLAEYSRKIGDYAPILISTQLVEAGVNLDFDVVFRAFAGVDSIAQAAGRCNREGVLLPKLGDVYIYEAEECLTNLRDISEAKRTALAALSAIETDLVLSPDEKDPIGLKAVEEFFERFYWSRRDEMDKERIICRLAACRQLEQAADIPFADIARDFNIIKEDTVSVIVPYGPQAGTIIAGLKAGRRLTLDTVRIAQQHSVQVYRTALPQFDTIIDKTPSGWLVVDSSLHYRETGLQCPTSIQAEDLIP